MATDRLSGVSPVRQLAVHPVRPEAPHDADFSAFVSSPLALRRLLDWERKAERVSAVLGGGRDAGRTTSDLDRGTPSCA